MSDEAPTTEATTAPPQEEAPPSGKGNKKKLKAQQEEQRQQKAKQEDEVKRAVARENLRWKDCLMCLKTSVPRLKDNPWLIIQEPIFIHNYLDSLTETLANLSKHEDDLDQVRVVLQFVYETFVDLGKFAMYQPTFYISHQPTVKRFVRLLEQVAHRGSDKALFPNVLSLLGPTFDRPELYDLLADCMIVNSLMSFARTSWMPTPSTLKLLLTIFKKICVSERVRTLFRDDDGFEKLRSLADGYEEGFTKEQQVLAKQALEHFQDKDADTLDPEGETISNAPSSPKGDY